jgi:hypothetical protein
MLKLRGTRQRAEAKTGRCEGAKPYGDLPGEAAAIERMRRSTRFSHGRPNCSQPPCQTEFL